MYSARSPLFLSLILIASAPAFVGCDEEEELPPGASTADEAGRPVGDIELPVSLRTKDAPPSGSIQVEATVDQLRLDGKPVVGLDRGRVPKSDWNETSGVIPKLQSALSGSTRSSVRLRMQANVAYETVALVLNTARKAGVRNVGFQVRTGGNQMKPGWITVNGFSTSSKAESLPEIPGAEYRSWNDFTKNWQTIFDGCRTSSNGNCAYVNENFAEGGTLRMELMASGRGLNVNFFRRGLTPEQEAEEERKQAAMLAQKKEDFLQGRITEEEMVEAILLGHPSTYALFQFRYQEALKAPSALGATIEPMCSGQSCGMIITADPITHLSRVVSMIGAAFPDGTQLPKFAFELPWTEKPKPADLQEFIERQQALEGR
ncbi:MAG: hypothetical protein PVI30_10630 [Myxococcales bacterium]